MSKVNRKRLVMEENDDSPRSVGFRLVFIDVDGVLNHGTRAVVEPHKMEMLALLLRETCATPVLSTAWRLTRDARLEVEKAFLGAGAPKPLSCTPEIRDRRNHRNARGNEVLAWLQRNTLNILSQEKIEYGEFVETEEFTKEDYTLEAKIRVTSWVVIDDRNMYGLRPHFVHTQTLVGLTEDEVEEARKILSEDGAPCGPLRCNHCGTLNDNKFI
jgi:hypothetical protein